MKKILAATALITAMGAPAFAAPVGYTPTGEECSIDDVMISTASSDACIGLLELGTGSSGSADLSTLSDGGFTLVESLEGDQVGSQLDIEIGSDSGSFSISDADDGHDYALVFKAAANMGTQLFAAYLLTADLIAEYADGGTVFGTFTTDAFLALSGGENAPALSNASLFKRGGGDTPPPIPLPAAGWMLIAGVGGLAALRRRRKC